ncbi:MAG: hypothetical protein ABIF08_02425 [Nanoarchaeota archaeon]
MAEKSSLAQNYSIDILMRMIPGWKKRKRGDHHGCNYHLGWASDMPAISRLYGGLGANRICRICDKKLEEKRGNRSVLDYPAVHRCSVA